VALTALLVQAVRPAAKDGAARAIFAGGCFWSMELAFDGHDGITSVIVGYAGGTGERPTYEDYARKGFREAVLVTYDPSRITFAGLLDIFWRHIDPTDDGGQFCDRGPQYAPALYYGDEGERREAEESRKALAESGRFRKPLATEILRVSTFYAAEEYHQHYAKKNPFRYRSYSLGCGRNRYLQRVWGKDMNATADPPNDWKHFVKPDKKELRKILTPLQYQVTQEKGTESAFHNAYWDNEREGIYVDIVSGEPLFSSKDQFHSGTGWPSFTRPLDPHNIKERTDLSLLPARVEVRSVHGGSHLGHVFNDGPPPTGLRYCMNSAALRFIPKEDLEKEGYGEYLKLFQKEG